MSGSRQKLRAVLLSFVMVTSIMAAGVAFTGTASADVGAISNAQLTDVEANTDGVEQVFRADIDTASDTTTITIDLNKGDNNDIVKSTISATEVTDIGTGSDLTVSNLGSTSNGEITFDVSSTDGTGSTDGTAVVRYSLDTTVTSPFDDTTTPETAEITATGISGQDVSYDVDSKGEGPVITGAETLDEGPSGGSSLEDGSTTGTADNGKVDAVVVTFDKAVKDTSVDHEDFQLDSADTGSGSDETASGVTTGDTRLEGGITDDNKLVMEIQEDDGSTFFGTDTSIDPLIDYQTDGAGDDILQTAGTSSDASNSNQEATDAAEPAITDAQTADTNDDGNIDQITAVMSEPIDNDGGSTEGGEFTGVGDVSIGSNDLGGGADDNQVVLTLSSSVSGTDRLPDDSDTITQVGGDIIDLNSNTQSSDVTQDTTDTARPVLLTYNGNTGEASADLTFSEPVDGNNDVPTSGEITHSDVNGAGAGSVTGVTDPDSASTDLTVGLNTGIASADIGTDTVFATTSVKDTDDNDAEGNSVTLQTNALAMGTDNGVEAEVRGGDGDDSAVDLAAGSANETLGQIRLRDTATDDSPAFSGTTTIRFPDGVTVDESASSLNTGNILTTDSDGVDVTGVSVNSDGNIVLDHGQTSSVSAESIVISSGAVTLSVDGEEIDTNVASPTNLPLRTTSFAGESSFTNAFKIFSPDASEGGPSDVSINTNGQTLDSTADVEITFDELRQTVETATAQSNRVLIGNQTNIQLTLESGTGVTFDTDSSISFGQSALDDDGIDELDSSQVGVSPSTITIPVVHDILVDDVDDDTSDIEIEGLAVDANGSATGTNLNVSITNSAPNTGAYTLDSSSSSPETFTDYVDVDSPTLRFDADGTPGNADDSLAVGRESQNVPSDIDLDADTAQNTLTANTNIIISTNSSDVSFVEQGTVDGNDVAGSGVTAGDISSASVNNDGEVVITLGSDLDANDELTISSGDDIGLSISSSATDAANVEFTASIDDTVSLTSTQTDTDDKLTLERADIDFNNQGNFTAKMDNDGITKAVIDPTPGGNDAKGAVGDNALVIDSDEGNDLQTLGESGGGTDIVISLPDDAGVTFDQSKSTANALDDTNSDVGIAGTGGDEINNIDYAPREITLTLAGNLGSADTITVDQLFINATTTTRNVSLSVETNPDTATSSTVQTTDDNIIKFTNAAPSDVFGDAAKGTDSADDDNGPNNNYGSTDSEEASATQAAGASPKEVGETFTSSIYVDNGNGFSSPADSAASGAFGNTDVDLSVVESPDGSSGASFNESALTTNSDGTADFEFTLGDVVGTYVVNASTSAGGVNITYEATSGQTSQLNVTQVKDGLATGTDSSTGTDTDVAIFRVRTEDSGGNIAPADVDFGTVFTGGSASVVELYEDYQVSDGSVGGDEIVSDGDLTNDNGDAFDDGDGDSRTNYIQSNDDNGQAGVFFVAVAGSTEQTVDIELAPESGDISSGSATADLVTVNDVDVAINDSTTSPESTVTATATPQSGDGDVTVPRLSASFSISNTTVATFDAASSVTTNVSGVATVNLTAEENGTATVSAITRNRQGSATITVEEDAPAYYTLELSHSIADRASQNTTNSTFSTHRKSGSTALLPRSVYRYTRTHTGGFR